MSRAEGAAVHGRGDLVSPALPTATAADPVVTVENVSKQFQLRRERAGDLRERFASLFRRRAAAPAPTESNATFWALRDISFTVRPGEAVGIVGHNGSGKSTLLKMLTGILEPATGHVRTRGRIGALIEVGAGFHPDLSGRENVYLNGSILGLSRREIAARFDQIVSFAGLERFIDTPVKRYSSGMFMRLGFSIAAHLDPEILIIDEVLAVGDELFQRKCLNHLKQFVARGGTVIFVSHAMAQVADLCQRCIWLDRGRLMHDGPTSEAVDQYMALVAEREEEEFRRNHPEEWAMRQEERRREAEAQTAEELQRAAEQEEARLAEASRPWNSSQRSRLLGAILKDATGQERDRFQAGEPLSVSLSYRFARPAVQPAFCLEIFRTWDNLHMFTTSNYDHNLSLTDLPQEGTVTFEVPFLSLNEGRYRIRLALYTDWRPGEWETCLEDVVENAGEFEVVAGRFAHGCTYIPVQWGAASAKPEGEMAV